VGAVTAGDGETVVRDVPVVGVRHLHHGAGDGDSDFTDTALSPDGEFLATPGTRRSPCER
jgi:hypothetical protein